MQFCTLGNGTTSYHHDHPIDDFRFTSGQDGAGLFEKFSAVNFLRQGDYLKEFRLPQIWVRTQFRELLVDADEF